MPPGPQGSRDPQGAEGTRGIDADGPGASYKRVWIQAPLGFSAGVPLTLTGSMATAWLATEGVDIKTIGPFALVAIPYNLKWLWAPLLDRYFPPFLGRRRGWLIVFQLLLAAAIASMGAVELPANVATLAVLAVAVAFFSASQDIVVDAYRTDVLRGPERGKGTSTYVAGYRIAMILTGTGGLYLAAYVSWQTVYWLCASLLIVGAIATVLAPEPSEIAPPRSLRAAMVDPLAEFFGRHAAALTLVFIMLFQIGDRIAGHMSNPFLIQALHFELTDIALLQKFLGSGATIIGAAIGGVMIDRIGVRRGLLWFGMAQAAANLGYVLLAIYGKSYAGLVAAIGIDNVCNGLGAAAFVAFLMSLCHKRYSAAQYALFSSASSVVGRLLAASGGVLVDEIGWASFFGVSIVVAVPALVLWWWLPPPPAQETDSAPAARPAKPLFRAIGGGVAVAFAGAAIWQLVDGDWKTGVGLAVPALAFLAYSLAVRPQPGSATGR